MRIKLKKNKGLERSLQIALVDGELEKEVNARLRRKAGTAVLPGFRKGKTPMSVIERRFGDAARQEALQKLIGDSLAEALNTENLRPAETPRVEDASVKQGQVHYTATFEVLPDVEVVPAEKLSVEKPECEIGEEDVDAGLEQLRRHYRDLRPVPRKAATGDVVEYEITATMPDGKTIGPKRGRLELIDSPSTPKNMADALTGALSGDERRITLPVETPAGDGEGEPRRVDASCQLKALTVLEPVLPEWDQAFFDRLNCANGMPQVRREVRRNMEEEAARRLRDRQWWYVRASLLSGHPDFPLPRTMIENARQDLTQRGLDEKTVDSAARDKVREQLIVAAIVQRNDLRASHTAVRRLVESAAAGHKDSAAFISWHYADEGRLSSFQALALRDRVMDWLLEQASVKPVSVSYSALVSGAP